MNETGFGTFFVPGPTEVRKEVLEAMLKPMIPHRSSEFESLFARLQTGLKEIFQTKRPVYVASSSATGMMEAAIRCAPPGRILCLVNGAFSERFAKIAEQCGRGVDRYEVAWSEVHSPEALDDHLSRSEYRAITVAHSETSTGALNSIRALSDVAHSRGVLCLVDSVSGLGGAELRFDEWGLDYVLTGSQKALALPPGLAFAVASPEFVSMARETPGRGVYFDIAEMDEYLRQGQVPSTPSISLLYALEVQLEAVASEGVEARWKRHADMAALTQGWIARMSERDKGWRNIVRGGSQSPTVSTIELPASLGGSSFTASVAGLGFRVGGGYGKLRDTTFRIGHMGDHSVATVERCLEACERAVAA
ncbi:MAG TPA: alanine--glyoxylate aminotransferase family protein [Gemmatimonadaceae bacterium]|nr:alanine--glyoxylate aminotransferase family protein [Gemmatimonadaceae bacterium]